MAARAKVCIEYSPLGQSISGRETRLLLCNFSVGRSVRAEKALFGSKKSKFDLFKFSFNNHLGTSEEAGQEVTRTILASLLLSGAEILIFQVSELFHAVSHISKIIFLEINSRSRRGLCTGSDNVLREKIGQEMTELLPSEGDVPKFESVFPHFETENGGALPVFIT